MKMKNTSKATIIIYLKSGQVFSYEVSSPFKGREHAWKIWREGYRSNDGKEFCWYGPHWIDKIKIIPAPKTAYIDRNRGT